MFHIEVDVAVRYPPSPGNIATTFHVIATDRGQLHAELTAIAKASTPGVVMATAVRVTAVEI